MICFYIGCAVNLAFFAVVLYAVARVRRGAETLTNSYKDAAANVDRIEKLEARMNDVEKNATSQAELDVKLEERVDAVQTESIARVAKLRQDCEATAKTALGWKNEGFERLTALEEQSLTRSARLKAFETLALELRKAFDDLAARFDKIEKEHVQYAKARNFAVDAFYRSNRAVRECLKQYEEETNENATI